MNGMGKAKPAVGGGGQNSTATNAGVRHIYFSTTNKPVATLCGRTLQKRVRGSIHMLRRPPAWCVDAAILVQARKDGAQMVEVTDIETRRIYRAAVDAFALHGFKFNRGHGDQIGLALSHWRIEPQDAKQMLLFEV